MSQQTSSPHELPPLPEVGHPERYYAKGVRQADRDGDLHAHAAWKVGQYVTLGCNPQLIWDEKLKYFIHALRRHCVPPHIPEEHVWVFYRSLADLIRKHAGEEALRLACKEDDLYAMRIDMGQARETIEIEAENYFTRLLGNNEKCPDYFNEEDWAQIKMIRDQWI